MEESFREEYLREIKEEYSKEIRKYYIGEDVEEIQSSPSISYREYEEDRKEWIPKHKFLRDLRKKGTDSNEIYREWKKNNK